MDILENSRQSAARINLSSWERDEPEEVIDQVHQRQAQQLFYQAWVHNLGSIIVACCATIAVWQAVNHVHLLLWLTLFTLIYICRWGIALRFAQVAPQGSRVRNWVRLQFAAIIASSMAYGAPAIFLWPEGYPLEQMAWVITVTAITAAAVARYSVWKYAELPFIFFALIPVTLRLLLHGGLNYTILGVLGLVYSLVLLQIGRVMHTSNLENLLVSVKNQELSRNLAGEINKVTQLNQQLVEEMDAREQAFSIVRKQELELEQARRMEAIGLLSAGVAHELNSPLQFVGDNLEFIGEGLRNVQAFIDRVNALHHASVAYPGMEALADRIEGLKEDIDIDFFLEEMHHAENEASEGIRRVSKIVQALQLYAGPESKVKTPIDLNLAMESVILLTHNLWKDVCLIHKSYQENLPLLQLRSQEINQVLLNIFHNGLQAIMDKMALAPFQGEITITTELTDKTVRLLLSDNGIGIPESIGERIFEDFFTTREVGQGMGQGLSFAYRVLHNHGGTLSYSSREQQGTTFILELPISESGTDKNR